MSQHRTASKIIAGVALVAGLVVGFGAPAQANDTGWGGTRIISDTGWGGTSTSNR